MANSDILVRRQGDRAFIQIVGRGSFQNASSFKAFYERLLPQGVTRFDIDLKLCTYLDSTFLGTITGLGMKLRNLPEGGTGHLCVFNAGERNLELMSNLGIDKVKSIELLGAGIEGAPADGAVEKLSNRPVSKEQTGSDMLEAHENLVAADPANAPKFQDVIAYLKEDQETD